MSADPDDIANGDPALKALDALMTEYHAVLQELTEARLIARQMANGVREPMEECVCKRCKELMHYSLELVDGVYGYMDKCKDQEIEIAELKAKNQRLEARLNKDHI